MEFNYNANRTDEDALSSLKRGDNFRLGPYHFVCMGWQNGRILATRHEEHKGFFMHSLFRDIVFNPMFKIIGRAEGTTL